MKALVAILATLLLTATWAYGKKNAGKLDGSHYGIGLSEINTGTGHGVGYAFNANILKGRKSLEVGLIYSDRESKVAGGDFKYEIYLGNIHRIENGNKIYQPYIQYNLIYEKGTSYSPDIVNLNGTQYEINSNPGTVATIGHFFSYGNKIRIFDNAYFDSSLGLGMYRGSLDKVNGPDTWGIHNTNSGFTFSFKIGFGYTFN